MFQVCRRPAAGNIPLRGQPEDQWWVPPGVSPTPRKGYPVSTTKGGATPGKDRSAPLNFHESDLTGYESKVRRVNFLLRAAGNGPVCGSPV